MPAIREWKTFAGPRDEIRVSDQLRVQLNFVLPDLMTGGAPFRTGIDTFANLIAHEKRHVVQVTENNALPFYKGVSGAVGARAASGWSFNVPPGDPLYNHFDPGPDGKPGIAGRDDNGNGQVDEQIEAFPGVGGDVDLDGDGDDLGNINDINNIIVNVNARTVESQAQDAETIPQDSFRSVDWSSPGKQHGPDGGSTRGEINMFNN